MFKIIKGFWEKLHRTMLYYLLKINKISFKFCSIGLGSINNGPINFECYGVKALLWEDEQWVSRTYFKVSKLVSETQ